MGGLGFLSRLFSGGGSRSSSDAGVHFKVRCDACGEIVQGRISPTSELSQSDEGGYYVRKVLVGRQCFRSIEVQIHYSDLGRTETSREVKGGTSVE